MADNPKNLNVEVVIPEDVRKGVYSNLCTVTTTSGGEVIVDFVFTHPNDKKDTSTQLGTVVARVIMNYELGKALKLLLESQLGKNKKE